MATRAKKNPAAVALGRKGGKKGGLARAANLTPEQRSESARNAVQARWAKVNLGKATPEAPTTALATSKKDLHRCLKLIKEAKNETEIRRLTEELQRSSSAGNTRMPKLRKPPPYFMRHLVERFREGRISVADFSALQEWLNSDPEVPTAWCRNPMTASSTGLVVIDKGGGGGP